MIQQRSPDYCFSQIGPKSLPEAEPDPKHILKGNFWQAFWDAKSRQNRSKIDHLFRHDFWSLFLSILVPFWKHLAFIFVTFFHYFFKLAISSIFLGSPIRFAYFWRVRALQNRSKIDQKTHPNWEHAFCQLFGWFCPHFDLRLRALWPPEGLPKMHQKSDLEKNRLGISLALVSRSPPYAL